MQSDTVESKLTAPEQARLDKVLEIALKTAAKTPTLYVSAQSPTDASQAKSAAFVAIFQAAIDEVLST